MTTKPTDNPARGPVVLLGGLGIVMSGLAAYSLGSGARRFADTGDSFPGAVTSAAQLLGHFTATLAGAACLGGLILILTTAVPDEEKRLCTNTFRIHVTVERVAPWWSALAAGMVVVTAAANAGVPVSRLAFSTALGDAVAASEPARGWIAAAFFSAVVAIGARFTVRWVGHLLLVVPALLAVIAVPVTGNAGQGPDHDVTTSAVIVFALALAVLTGVKLSAVLSPPGGDLRRRIQLLEVGAGAVAVVYGAVLAALMTAGTTPLSSEYGRLLLCGAALLTAVWLIDLADLVRPGWLAPAASVGTAVAMAAVTGCLSAMALQAPPRFRVHEFTLWDIFLGYELPGPPTGLNLVTVWRFDPLLGTGAIVLAAAYLVGALRLRRRGDHWPTGRTVAWLAGCAALLITTGSGVRAYGSAMFSVHMGEHMALNMFVPVLLVLGAPVTLALRALPPAKNGAPPGPREWLLWFVHSRFTRFISHPVTVFVMFVGSLYAVYFSPLFDTLVRYHWGHEFMSVHFLLTGYLFFWGIIGIDPGPKRLPFLGRLGLLFAVMPFHAFFGIATMTMGSALGASFYRNLNLPWLTSLSADQHLGGAIAWGSSELPVLIVVVVLVAQWARQDGRAAARRDRHSDTGYDDDLDAYNAMLRELARNRR